MRTHEKIDLLMKITESSNSALGKVLNFDASYISRIRTGKRKPPRNPELLEAASLFFASRIATPYQKKLVGDMLPPGIDWPENQRAAQKLIASWLQQPEGTASAPVGQILSNLSNLHSAPAFPTPFPPVADSGAPERVQFFYGNEGKRQAVIQFLSDLIQMEHPPMLLLYSNEEFSWMYEDPAFAKRWAMLLFTYIKKGGRIKIAHTISRASGEMLMALQKWIPVYMTGAIEPYYYPKILDRVFRKTMFIAEGYSAIFGSSVGEHFETSFNCLTYDRQAVKCLEKEYWAFFELCKPLMRIYNLAGREEFFDVLKDFNASSGSMFTVRTTPSFYTMPDAVARSMTKRLNSSWLLRRQQIGNETFKAMMERGESLTEILNLPDPEDIRTGKVPFPVSDLFDKPGLTYFSEEFVLHLEAVVEKLKTCKNYNVVLSSAIPANEIVHVKEDTGVVLVKNDPPSIAFAISEQRMVSAFWDYLSALSENADNREKTIARLEAFMKQLL